MDFFKRLESFRSGDESENAFARRIGVKPETLRGWRKNYAPRWESLVEPAERLGTTVLWLLEGLGPKSRAEFDEFIERYSHGLRTKSAAVSGGPSS